MKLSRRSFLTGAVAATAGGILVAADVFSTKTFILPPKGGWRPEDLVPVPQTRYSTLEITTHIPLNPMDIIDVGGTKYRVTAVNYVPSGKGGPTIRKYALVPANGMFIPVKEDRWNHPVVHEVKEHDIDTKTMITPKYVPLARAHSWGDKIVEPAVEWLDGYVKL